MLPQDIPTPHLWTRAVDSDQKSEIAATNGQLRHMEEAQSRAAAPLHWEAPDKVDLARMPKLRGFISWEHPGILPEDLGGTGHVWDSLVKQLPQPG